MNDRKVYVSSGLGVGGFLAAICSWIANKSIIWAFIHFLCGWLYVLYACCAHTEKLESAIHEATTKNSNEKVKSENKNGNDSLHK